MNVEIAKIGTSLKIKIHHHRLDGDNFIYNGLKNENHFTNDIELVEIDFEPVEFINSLGITELVNIHRKFSEINYGKTNFRFINVDKKVNAILELVEIQKIAEIILKK